MEIPKEGGERGHKVQGMFRMENRFSSLLFPTMPFIFHFHQSLHTLYHQGNISNSESI